MGPWILRVDEFYPREVKIEGLVNLLIVVGVFFYGLLRVKTNFIRLGLVLVEMWIITFVVYSINRLRFNLTFLDYGNEWRDDTFVEDQNTQSQRHQNRFDHLLATIIDSLALGNLNVVSTREDKVADSKLRTRSEYL